MKVTGNGTNGHGGRDRLAGASARRDGDAGVDGGHGRTSVETEGVRRLRGTRSGERTAPRVTSSMRAAVRIDAPRARNLNLRIVSGETPPTAVAMTVSDTPLTRIQSAKIISALPTAAPRAPAVLPPDRLAVTLAVFASELIGALPISAREASLERLAGRLLDHGRLPGGSEAALLLGAIGGALVALEG